MPTTKLWLVDQAFAASSKMYPGRSAPTETELPVTEVQGMAASIGQAAGSDGKHLSLSCDQPLHKEISMPVILWLLGVPLALILLFMLVF